MEILGGGKLHIYNAIDEGPHTPGPQMLWQESVVLVWWDIKQSIGGFYRIGHEPNQEAGPKVSVFSHTFLPQGIFSKTTYLPLRTEDQLKNGFCGGDGSIRFEYDGQCIWTIEDTDISAQIRVHDFHPSIDCYPKKGSLAEDVAPNHMEVAGKVSGRLAVKGVSHQIDGLAFRDHGWGQRDWNTLLSHRWAAAVFGPELSFVALSWHSVDDVLIQFGWVVKHDKLIYAKQTDIVAYTECDAMTTRGGHVRMTLTTGEVIDAEFEALAPGGVSCEWGIASVDTMCRVRCGDKVGIGDFETTSNSQHGKRIPKRLSYGVIGNGWHPAAGA